jgi:hypothetical protein
MKETVDPDALRRAVNTAIKRYPYFAVEVVLGDDGGYDLIPNGRDVVVLPTSSKLPQLGSEAANRHLLFVDTEGRDIFFNISHSLCGGRGIMPWIMTTIYQYVVEKHHVTPDAPGIRKPNSSLLPGEGEAPTIDMLLDEEPIYRYKSKNPVTMIFDYLNGMFNPFMRKPIYYQFTFNQKDVMSFAKENDASVASFFIVAVAKAMDKLLPEKHKVIGAEIAHNPSKDIGMPNTHCDITTFLNGGMGHFDKISAVAVSELKPQYPNIELLWIKPYPSQKVSYSDLFDDSSLYAFDWHIDNVGPRKAIPERNEYMVLCKA